MLVNGLFARRRTAFDYLGCDAPSLLIYFPRLELPPIKKTTAFRRSLLKLALLYFGEQIFSSVPLLSGKANNALPS